MQKNIVCGSEEKIDDPPALLPGFNFTADLFAAEPDEQEYRVSRVKY